MGAIQQGDGPKLKRPEAQLPRGKIRFSVTALRIWIFLNFNFKLISVLAFFAKRILSFTIFDKRDHSLLFLRMADVNVTISKEKEKKVVDPCIIRPCSSQCYRKKTRRLAVLLGVSREPRPGPIRWWVSKLGG